MKRLDIAATFGLALGLSVGCAVPQSEETARPVQQSGDPFAAEAREALDELTDDFEALTTANARLEGDRAQAWAEARDEIVDVRRELGTDLDRLGAASRDDADGIRGRITQNVEAMTHHIERAKLHAADGSDELVTAARERLTEVDRDIQSLQSDVSRLPMEAREEASKSVEDLRSQANDVKEAVMSLTNAAPQEIEEQRGEVAEDVAALSASVRRETLEMRAELNS